MRPKVSAAVATLAILGTASCGRGPDGGSWIVISGEDTLTVADAGRAWNELDETGRQMFVSGENPVGDFVVGIARRMLVEKELTRLGYLDSEGVALPALAWARNAMSTAFQDSLRAVEASAVTGEDLAFYREHLGTTVWYTVTGEDGLTRTGPAHLAVLGPERGGVLAGLAPGGTAPDPLGEGTLRLDSVAFADSELVARTLADSEYVEQFATARFAEWRAGRVMDDLMGSAWEASPPLFFRPAFEALAAYFRGEADLDPADTLVVFGPQVWTASQMLQEIAFEAGQRPSYPADTTWLYSFARVLVNNSVLSAEYGIIEPAAAGELMRESARMALRIAADSLYDDFVEDSILITEEMLDSVWTLEPVEIPETRSLVIITMQDEGGLLVFKQAVISGRADSVVSSMGSMWHLSGGGPDPHVTRPLYPHEVPFGLGDSVFALDPSDTSTWLGPVSYPDMQGWMALRLDSVVTAHPASPEEARIAVFPQVLQRERDARTADWLAGLEESYGLVINQDILDDLPADPSLWEDL